MEKNAWYVCGQVAERIDDAPILKEYIKSKVSEPPDELFFFSSSHLDRYWSASGRNKMEFPGAILQKDRIVYGRQLYPWRTLYRILSWCCGIEETSNLGSCCSNDSWVGPETERIPQPIPDPNNRGHFMDVYQTESTSRTPDDSRENVWRTCMRKIPSVS